MPWIIFYIFAAAHVITYCVILLNWTIPWKMRFIYILVLSIPAALYCSEYFIIKYEHDKSCAEDSGLRVFTKPEKSNEVRFAGETAEEKAQFALDYYYPKLTRVEAQTGNRDADGRRLKYYDSYKATPNPNRGKPMKTYPWKEREHVISIERAAQLGNPMYEIRTEVNHFSSGEKIETRLMKNNHIYAKHTEYYHFWTGIRYPDSMPSWRCPDPNRKESNKVEAPSTSEKRSSSMPAAYQLLNLILQ